MKNFMMFVAILSIALCGNVTAQDDVSVVVEITGSTFEEKAESLRTENAKLDALVAAAEKEAAALRATIAEKENTIEEIRQQYAALGTDRAELREALAAASTTSPLFAEQEAKREAAHAAVLAFQADPSDENKKALDLAENESFAARTAYETAIAKAEQFKGGLVGRHKLMPPGVDILAALEEKMHELYGNLSDLRMQIGDHKQTLVAKATYVDALQKRAQKVKDELDMLVQEQSISLRSEQIALNEKQVALQEKEVALHETTNELLRNVITEVRQGNGNAATASATLLTRVNALGRVTENGFRDVNQGIKEVNTNLAALQQQNERMFVDLTNRLTTLEKEDPVMAKDLAELLKIVREALAKKPNDPKVQATAAIHLGEAQRRLAPQQVVSSRCFDEYGRPFPCPTN